VIDESDLQFKKQFEPRISTFFGIKIDWSDDPENAPDSIRVNGEFDSNVIDESDLQDEKQFHPRISIWCPISIVDDFEKFWESYDRPEGIEIEIENLRGLKSPILSPKFSFWFYLENIDGLPGAVLNCSSMSYSRGFRLKQTPDLLGDQSRVCGGIVEYVAGE
jgi:hypothetical protein